MRISGEKKRLWGAAVLVVGEVLLGLCLTLAVERAETPESERRIQSGALVRTLELTDLAIGSGAAYTRHPSGADLFAAHSEQPGGFEHQPGGSVVPAHPGRAQPWYPTKGTEP